jgi:iron complex outermembrane receptor protein
MNRNYQYSFTLRIAAGAALFLIGTAPALSAVEEITVTARRIEESLQETPVSVTSFSEQVLEQARIQDVDDLANFTPNLTFDSGESGRQATPVIRGMSLIDTRGFDNSVGVFIDGIFVSGRAVQNVRLLDVERVEVVRGPQSALYGRNTFAGAINYVSKKPTNELDVKLEATAAEDDLYQVMGSVSGPLIADKLQGRIAASYEDDEGTFENAGPLAKGDGIGGHEFKSISGALRFLPTDSSSVTLSGYYADDLMDSRPMSVAPNNCGDLDPAQFNQLTSYDAGHPAYFCGDIPATQTDQLALSPDAYSYDAETTRISLDIAIDFSAFRLTSMTSYTESDSLSNVDLDRSQAGESHYGWLPSGDWAAAGFPVPLFSFLVPFVNPPFTAEQELNSYIGARGLESEYWSQEFRFESSSDGPFRWLGGLYFFDSENDDSTKLGVDASAAVTELGLPTSAIQFLLTDTAGPGATLGLPHPILPNSAFLNGAGSVNLTEGIEEATQYAAFGSVEYDFTDRLTGTAELRYTYEERSVNNIRDDFFNNLPNGPTSYEDDWSFWDPRFILRYQATDDFMVYGSVAKGSRSGGLNPLVSDPELVTYDEESNWTFESGFKSTWLDNRVQLNMAAFYVDWQDAQFRQQVGGSTAGFLTITTNSTGITTYGLEAELAVSPMDGLLLSFGYGYSNPEFDSGTIASGQTRLCDMLPASASAIPVIPVTCVDFDADGDGLVDDQAPDIGGKQLHQSSKHTAAFSAELVQPFFVEGLEWMTRFDVSYRSEQPSDFTATQWVPDRTLANFRLGILQENYDVTLWVENLFDEDSIENGQNLSTNLNSLRTTETAVNIVGRRFGITGRVRF